MALVYVHRMTLPDGSSLDEVLHRCRVNDDVRDAISEFDETTELPFMEFFLKTRARPLGPAAFSSDAQVRKMRRVFLDPDSRADIGETLQSAVRGYRKAAIARYGKDDAPAVEAYVTRRKEQKRRELLEQLQEEEEEETLAEGTARSILCLLFAYYTSCAGSRKTMRPFRVWVRVQAEKHYKADSLKLEKLMIQTECGAFKRQLREWMRAYPEQDTLQYKKNPLRDGERGARWDRVLFIKRSDCTGMGDKSRVNRMFRKLSKLFHPDKTAHHPLLKEYLAVRWLILNEARDEAHRWFAEKYADDDDTDIDEI